MHQNFKQLRNVCIKNSLPYCNGVLTNFKQWYFTRYSLSREFKPVEGKSIFEASKKYIVVKENNVIDQEKLSNVVKILYWLTCYAPTASDSQKE